MLEIQRIGCNFIHPNGIQLERPKGSDTYLFLYFRSDVEIKINDIYCPQKEPCFYLFPKNTPQFYRKQNGAFNNDWMHITCSPNEPKDELEDLFSQLQIPFETPMIIHNSTVINNLMADLRNEFFLIGHHHNEIMDAKLRAFFYKFSDMLHEEITFSTKLIRYREPFVHIRNQLYSFQSDASSVPAIAASLNLSVSYFQHIYKELFGVSLTHDIIQSRIDKACHLLHTTRDSISDIAYACGYENKEHFSRQFKKIIGCSPKDYRN